jgi:hypothetical protein
LARQARILGKVTVVLSEGPDGAINAVKTGHSLLVPGVEPDADHWKEWAAMGVDQVDYVFKLGWAGVVTTRVQVPRNRLVRMIPWVRKTKTQEYTEAVKFLRREIELSGKTLHIVITANESLVQPSISRVTT